MTQSFANLQPLHSLLHIDMLESSMIPITHGLCISDDFIVQQDNARCHTSRETMAWFQKNDINVMTWPGQSPDMNPIEKLRDGLGTRLDGCNS